MAKLKKSKFLKIVCPRCNLQQIVFGKSSSHVKCKSCNYLLLKPQGGKAKIRALVRKILWH